MLPYLHILIRVEDDGSLHALGAFTSREKLSTYQKDTGLADDQVRLDYYNGPFDESIEVVYAGHRHWNMDRFQLGGYFKSEGEAWNWVTAEGYVSVLRIDITYQEEQQFEQEALELYQQLQKRWRLATYATDISYYRSKQIKVYEFRIKAEDFKTWAGQNGMSVQRVTSPEILSRYKAYIPAISVIPTCRTRSENTSPQSGKTAHTAGSIITIATILTFTSTIWTSLPSKPCASTAFSTTPILPPATSGSPITGAA